MGEAVSVYATSSSSALQSPFPGTLTLHDGKVTAQLTAVPLGQVMAEVSRLSGVPVVWLEETSRLRLVSVRFTALPLLRALDRLLSETNFLLTYADRPQSPQITHIWIAAQRQHLDPRQMPFSHPPFLTGTTFTGDEPLKALIQTALYAPDAAARVRMVEQLGLRDHEDDRVRSILSLMAFEDNDPTVRKVAAEMFYSLGNQTEEVAKDKENEEDRDEFVEE